VKDLPVGQICGLSTYLDRS